jgi:hypothetical protein
MEEGMKNPNEIPIPKAMRSHPCITRTMGSPQGIDGEPIKTMLVGRQVMLAPNPIRDFVHDVWRYYRLRRQAARKGRPGWRHTR